MGLPLDEAGQCWSRRTSQKYLTGKSIDKFQGVK